MSAGSRVLYEIWIHTLFEHKNQQHNSGTKIISSWQGLLASGSGRVYIDGHQLISINARGQGYISQNVLELKIQNS